MTEDPPTTLRTVKTSNEHIGIWGMTGSGKTYLANYLHGSTPPNKYSIFFNHQDEADIAGTKIDARDWKPKCLGARVLNVIPSMLIPKARSELTKVITDLMHTCKATHGDRRPGTYWVTVYIDEAHIYCPITPETMPVSLMLRCKRWGVKTVWISQNPANVNKILRSQLRYHVIFRLNNYNIPYFKRHYIPIEEIMQKTRGPYYWVIWDGEVLSDPYRCKPKPEEVVKPK